MRNTLASLLLATALVLPACAESAPPDAEYDALAQLLAAETTARATAFADAALVVRGELPAGLVRDSNGVVRGGRDGVTYHYWAGGTTVLAWWEGAARSQGIWDVHGANAPVARVAGPISLMYGAAGSLHVSGDGDALAFVDSPSGLVLAGAVHDVVELTSGDHVYDVLVDVTFPSAGRALMVLDDRSYEVDLTPAPPVLR
ncbi:MAG: hypothetical protein JNL83_33610 [Myxococcales bacterium]|nr:hypothetical protein [Myxococcales bacterium]